MIALFDLIEIMIVVVFLYLALSQVVLPAIRGTQWFPMLHSHTRVLRSEEMHVKTQLDHAWDQVELTKLRMRLARLEAQARSVDGAPLQSGGMGLSGHPAPSSTTPPNATKGQEDQRSTSCRSWA